MSNPLYTPPASQASGDNPLYTPQQPAENPLYSPMQSQHAVTQPFGNVNPGVEVMSGGVNSGTDFDYKTGTPVTIPPGQWEVQEAYGNDTQPGHIGDSTNRGYGNSVYAKNLQTGETIRLSHLSSVDVKPGQILNGGYVGKSGATGNVTGEHLDVEYTDKTGKLSDITKTPYSY